MSEPEYESIVNQLHATAPPAPDRLRKRVGALREPQAKRVWRLRPALVGAAAIAVTVGVGAAAIGGLTGSTAREEQAVRLDASRLDLPASASKAGSGAVGSGFDNRRVLKKVAKGHALSPLLPYAREDLSSGYQFNADPSVRAPALTGARLQQYAVSMSLRVRDLSRATQAAVRQTRRLGGYVAAADYSTGGSVGDSSLELRVPVSRIQPAIARFTELGTILSQRISVADLQAPLDRTDARIAAQQRVIAELETKNFRTPAEQTRLDEAKRTLKRLSQSRSSLVREGTYAKISLQLTTRKTAAKSVAPGRFDRFWGDAGDILGKEAVAMLYALVVAGPFAILAALALLGERARRRRADHRLLQETG